MNSSRQHRNTPNHSTRQQHVEVAVILKRSLIMQIVFKSHKDAPLHCHTKGFCQLHKGPFTHSGYLSQLALRHWLPCWKYSFRFLCVLV